MVNLSLQHRVKLERQATLLSETDGDGSHKVLFWLSAVIAVFNILFFIAGAVTAGTIDYSWYNGPGAPHSFWYKDDSISAQKAKLVFFYCTIPLVLSALSIYETIQHWRSTKSGLPLAILSASLGLVLWIVQFALQGNCIWTSVMNGSENSAGYCAFSLHDWKPQSFWETGLAVVYATHLILALMLLVRQSRAAGKPSKMPQAYAYHSAVEETEMHTDRDLPDRSAAPMLVPDNASSRAPSYRSASAFHEDLTPEKEKEMM